MAGGEGRALVVTEVASVQPFFELTVTRPWHWGVAVLGDPAAEVPARMDGQVVAVGASVIAIGVRHAQDIEADRFEGDWDWATATIRVRALGQVEPVERQVVCDVVLPTARERISLGDADNEFVFASPAARTRVIVSTDQVDQTGLDAVWIDLVPADG